MINFDGEADEGDVSPEDPLLTRNGAPDCAGASQHSRGEEAQSLPIECAEHSLLTEEDGGDVERPNQQVPGMDERRANENQQQVKLTNYHNLFFAGAPIQRPTDVAHIESQESIIPEAQITSTTNRWSGFDKAVAINEDKPTVICNRAMLGNDQKERIVILNQNQISSAGNFPAGEDRDAHIKKSRSPSGENTSTLSQSPGLISPSPDGFGSAANSQFSSNDSPRPRIQNSDHGGIKRTQLSHSNSRENIYSTTQEQLVFDCSKHNQQANQAKINPYNRSSISSYKSMQGPFAQTMYNGGGAMTSSIGFGQALPAGVASTDLFRGAQEPEPPEMKDHYDGPDLFKVINTQKFVLQNNFIPSPQMQTGNKVVTLDINQQQLLTESGENMTQERFLKSRQRQSRGAPNQQVLAPLSSVRQQSQEPTSNRQCDPQVAGSTIFGARIRSDSSGSFERRYDAASDEQGNSSNYSFEEPFVNISDEQLNQTVVAGRDIAILSQYESTGQLIEPAPLQKQVMVIPGTAASIASAHAPMYSKRNNRHIGQLANNFGFGNVADYSIASQPALNAGNIMNEQNEQERQQDLRRNTQQNGRVFTKKEESQLEEQHSKQPSPGILILAPSQVQMQQQSSKRSKRGVFKQTDGLDSELKSQAAQYSPGSIGSSNSRESLPEVLPRTKQVTSPKNGPREQHPSKKIGKVFTAANQPINVKAIKLKRGQVFENIAPTTNTYQPVQQQQRPRGSIVDDRQLRKIQVFDQGRPKFIETVSAQRLSQYSPQSSERSSVDSGGARGRGSGMSRNSRNSGQSNNSPVLGPGGKRGPKGMMAQQIQNLSFMFSTSQSNSGATKVFPDQRVVQQFDKSKLANVPVAEEKKSFMRNDVFRTKKNTNQTSVFQQTARPDGNVVIKGTNLKLKQEQRAVMATTIQSVKSIQQQTQGIQRRQTSHHVEGEQQTISPQQNRPDNQRQVSVGSFAFGSPSDPQSHNRKTIRVVRRMSSNKEAQDQVINQIIQQHAAKKKQDQAALAKAQAESQLTQVINTEIQQQTTPAMTPPTGQTNPSFQANLQSAERSPFKHKNITSTTVSSGNQRYYQPQPPITNIHSPLSDYQMSELGSSVSSWVDQRNNNLQRK